MAGNLLLLGVLLGPTLGSCLSSVKCSPGDGDIYQFNATLLDKSRSVSFKEYSGKVLLIYNTATYCTLTTASYHQINALAKYYQGKDFEILGFPSNEFGMQEPGLDYNEILNGVRHVRPGGGFEPKITYFEKVNTNGDKESEIYAFLKLTCSFVDEEFSEDLFYSPIKVGDVRWNFEKFLVGKDGKVHFRYHPGITSVEDLKSDIDKLI